MYIYVSFSVHFFTSLVLQKIQSNYILIKLCPNAMRVINQVDINDTNTEPVPALFITDDHIIHNDKTGISFVFHIIYA